MALKYKKLSVFKRLKTLISVSNRIKTDYHLIAMQIFVSSWSAAVIEKSNLKIIKTKVMNTSKKQSTIDR